MARRFRIRGYGQRAERGEQRLLATGVRLALESAAVEVVDALRAAGMRSILLKGPVLDHWLYAGERPPYLDVDLLVAPADLDSAERVLVELGFRGPLAYLPGHRPEYARDWIRDGVDVELHRTIIGVGSSAEEAWGILSGSTEPMALAGGRVDVLSVPARAMHVALHAAQHGFEAKDPLDDLGRALALLSDEVWAGAASLADRLDAISPFAAGLRMLPAGEQVAARLGLPVGASLEVVLRVSSPPRLALGFEHFMNTPGVAPKLRFLARELVPEPAFLRAWTGLARRGRVGLAAAYPLRLLWLVAHAGPALFAWRRARKQAKMGTR